MGKKEAPFDHFYKITPSYTVSYYRYHNQKEAERKPLTRVKNASRGLLSRKAQQNLRNCFNWLLIISDLKNVYSKKENFTFKFKLNFITLTLPATQMHSDQYIKSHMLEPFLKWMSRSHNAHSYIWKAETQNCGNIHFHITTNKFIHWKSIRSKWNRLAAKHNYCKVYQDGSNDKGDAATKAEAVYKTKALTGYIVSYFNKKDIFKMQWVKGCKKKQFIHSQSCDVNEHYYQKSNFRQIECSNGQIREYKRAIEGRIWGASSNLNHTAEVINSSDLQYQQLDKMMNNDWYTTTLPSDFWKLHLYNMKIINHLPLVIQDNIKWTISELKKNDEQQKYIEIESIY